MPDDTAFFKTPNHLQTSPKSIPERLKTEPTIYDAIKAGLLVPTQNFVQKLGTSCLLGRDDKGYSAAHWACLGGHVPVLRYLIEQGAPINMPSTAEPRSHPIHWACTNGHIAIVDILLQHNVLIDQQDGKGCTPLIVATQYGQTTLVGYLLGKGASLRLADKDGDNAMHWAAFKGHNELMRLLIYAGFNPKQKDTYGQTALHLASINGNLTAVRELCELDGLEIDDPDKNGKTPYTLAIGRKHGDVSSYLKRQSSLRKRIFDKLDFWSLVFGPPGNSKYPILIFMITILMWGYPMYLYTCLYYTWEELWLLHILFWAVNAGMWFTLYHANSMDPGYVPRNTPEYDYSIKQVVQYSEWKEGDNPLSRLCHTCRTVKPSRSKHCRICNRCVMHFDHHCPWIYNCVGYNNRGWFVCFTTLTALNAVISLYFGFDLFLKDGLGYILISGLAFGCWAAPLTLFVFISSAAGALQNLTTNEHANLHRYSYLKDSSGKFRNPYDRGYLKNLLEFFHFLPTVDLSKLDGVKVI